VKPRPGYVFELDARVLSEGSRLHRAGEPSFYGLQLADRLRVPKITVYRSLRRLTELGLVDRWWEDQDVATASGRPRRRLYALNQHGRDALPHAIRGARVFGRSSPRDSNGVTRPRRPGARLRPRPSGRMPRRRRAR
jgi:PadR family transcriptional regulator, regulatory protein PadR